jgi:hypothetical protein
MWITKPMRNWILRFKAAWFFSRHFPYTDLPRDYWTAEDARSWSHFKTSDTGRKINLILRNKVFDSATRACMEASDKAQYMCGFASGVKATVAELDALLDMANTAEGFGLSDEEMAALFEEKQML